MPFFGGRREPSPEPVVEPQATYEEPRKNSIFRRREPSPPTPEPVHEPAYEEPKKNGFFHRRAPSPTPTNSTRSTDLTSLSSSTYHTANHQEGGLFRRSTGSSKRGGILHRTFGNGNGHFEDDPSVLEARQRVQNAEAAEREADRALDEARASVRDARERVKQLEEEAREDARRAKFKQHQAREVSKLGKALGPPITLLRQGGTEREPGKHDEVQKG